jgi:hypothetical protein
MARRADSIVETGTCPSGSPNLADIEIGAFLLAVDNRPEKQELLRLIGTLVSE